MFIWFCGLSTNFLCHVQPCITWKKLPAVFFHDRSKMDMNCALEVRMCLQICFSFAFLLVIYFSFLFASIFIHFLFCSHTSALLDSAWILVVGWNWICVQEQSIITLGYFYIPQKSWGRHILVLENQKWGGKKLYIALLVYSTFFFPPENGYLPQTKTREGWPNTSS